MAEQPISLLPFYQGWDTYQELLLKAIEPLSEGQLSLRPAPQLRSIGDLATHIIGVRAGWLYYTLEKGDEHLVSLASQPARSAAELVNGLEATWQVIQDALNHWTIADLAELVRGAILWSAEDESACESSFAGCARGALRTGTRDHGDHEHGCTHPG